MGILGPYRTGPSPWKFFPSRKAKRGRWQLHVEQIGFLQDKLHKDKEAQKSTALALRKQGKTQAEVAALVGVSRRTVDEWETGDGSNVKNDKAYSHVNGIMERIFGKVGHSPASLFQQFRVAG